MLASSDAALTKECEDGEYWFGNYCIKAEQFKKWCNAQADRAWDEDAGECVIEKERQLRCKIAPNMYWFENQCVNEDEYTSLCEAKTGKTVIDQGKIYCQLNSGYMILASMADYKGPAEADAISFAIAKALAPEATTTEVVEDEDLSLSMKVIIAALGSSIGVLLSLFIAYKIEGNYTKKRRQGSDN